MVGPPTCRCGCGVSDVFGKHLIGGVDEDGDVLVVELEVGVVVQDGGEQALDAHRPLKRVGKPSDTKKGISKTPSSANSAAAFSGLPMLPRNSLSRVFASDICPPIGDRLLERQLPPVTRRVGVLLSRQIHRLGVGGCSTTQRRGDQGQ